MHTVVHCGIADQVVITASMLMTDAYGISHAIHNRGWLLYHVGKNFMESP